MAEMNQIAAQLGQFWSSRTIKQRWLLGAGAAVTVGIVALFANLMSAPDFKPLVSGLEPADAQTIGAQLKAKNIPYQVSPDGATISVPSEKIDAARLEVASNQSTRSGRLGFEIFDKVSWGQTEFDEKVNYQRALEGELERTIATLGNVRSARVHLVMATDSVFLDRDRGAKASVTLKLAHGGLTHDETSAIQRMVAGAVDGLKPGDVSIIDADSNRALGMPSESNTEDDGEREMTQRLITTLGPVVGVEHLRATVNIERDPTTAEQSEDKYDPTVSATLQIQRSDDESGAKPGVGGVPGTTSNVPQKLPNVPSPVGVSDGNEIHKTESATYGVNKMTRHLVEPAGRIKRITAAVLVDDVIVRKVDKFGKWSETSVKRSAQELQQIQTIAQNTIGIDPNRGDVITVQNLSFASSPDMDAGPASFLERTRRGLNEYAVVVRYGMLMLLFVLAYILMIRPLQKRVLNEVKLPTISLPSPDADALVSLPANVPQATSGTRALKEQIVQHVTAEPIQSARLLQTWLREGTE